MIGASAAVFFVAAAYFLLTLDRTRANSLSKDDTQAGLKIVLFGIILAGVVMAALGTQGLLTYVFGGFKGGSGPIKAAIPPIVVGALTVVIVLKAVLPRTNAATQRQAERYLLGALAIGFGVFGLSMVQGFLSGLFLDVPWGMNAGNISGAVVGGAVLFFTLGRFGAVSGWTAPIAPPPMQQPPQGYPPQGGGYPPQGGGYPPQGGGYPPQGGGGYPPQGGGGYPPQGGGGYPPQGGYGR
ncbi:MAG: hypothetical protein ABI467_02280 [Kofleriaceae bacterium]